MSPSESLYFLGSNVLDILGRAGGKKDILMLYGELTKTRKTSFVLFTYTLDWLFIINLIESNEKGEIIKCS